MKRLLYLTAVLAFMVGGILTSSAVAHANPTDIDVCGSGYGVGDGTPTSCAFAAMARVAWLNDGGASVISVYSPVTNRNYIMYCTTAVNVVLSSGYMPRTAVECNGGNDADVWFWGG